MKLKTDNYLQKLVVSRFFNQKHFHRIKLYKIIVDYLLDRDYENCKFLIKKIINEDSIVLDIGANMGQYACRLNNHIKDGKIFSFEPYNPNFVALRSMKKILRLNNVVPIHSAVSDKKGTLKLKIPVVNKNLVIGTQAVLEQYQSSEYDNVKYLEETVMVNTIDDFMKENNLQKVDFIKIDTEGAELSVLKGGLETIKKYLPVLSIEISPSKEGLNSLYQMGYEAYYVSKNNLVPFESIVKVNKLKGNLVLMHKKGTNL